MAKICNTCYTVCPGLIRGMCPTCNTVNDHTRRPPAQHRYPAEYQRNRTAILTSQPHCVWCGAPADTADHLTPRSQGGTHDTTNLVPACHTCNSARGNRPGKARG